LNSYPTTDAGRISASIEGKQLSQSKASLVLRQPSPGVPFRRGLVGAALVPPVLAALVSPAAALVQDDSVAYAGGARF
jgi:hypothetical protein